jgi:multidrug efflux pump subunit AcrA (membrane-fusion protein)
MHNDSLAHVRLGIAAYRMAGAEAVRVSVKLGRSSVNNIEVLSGVKVGDTVVLSDMSAWDAFDRLRLN